MFHKRPEKDMEHPPGQWVNKDVTLGDYIERKERAMEILPAKQVETIDEAYLRGYNDGIAEGFQRGIVWIRGK